MPRKNQRQPTPSPRSICLFGEGALRNLSAADVRNTTAIVNSVLRGDVDESSQKSQRPQKAPGTGTSRFAEARRAKAAAKKAEKAAEEQRVVTAEKEQDETTAEKEENIMKQVEEEEMNVKEVETEKEASTDKETEEATAERTAGDEKNEDMAVVEVKVK